ncbi:class I tRNA ligase family protein, partial [Candidatus Pelagibacter sp.]|nr:class I tRNA ligase family protein [Candidatus Pelagibacter sp.]
FTQGMVCHETYKDQQNKWLSPEEVTSKDGKQFYKKDNFSEKVIVGPIESMSKSKKNTIDPESIIKNYGADSVRLFILSDSPPEKDVQWSEQGMMAAFKFIQKLWTLNTKILEKIKINEKKDKGENLIKFTNQLIHKVTQNLEKFHYNVIVANLYEMYNFLIKEIDKPIKKEVLIENYRKILILMNPFIPHFTNECLSSIEQDKRTWPIVAQKDLIENEINLVVQIDGKKRAILKVKRDMSEKEILKAIEISKDIEKFLTKQSIKKIIFVPNRLINIII